MASARPLRDVFADLVGARGAVGDPAAVLSEHGHPGLPADLVAEAVVSYADTAPVEVAEQLAPWVMRHSAPGAGPVTGDEPGAGWLELLGTAPEAAGDEPTDLDGLVPAPAGSTTAGPGPEAGPDLEAGLEFGAGAGSASGWAPDVAFETTMAEPAEIPGIPAERSDAVDWLPAAEDPDLTAEEPGDDEGELAG